MVPLKISEEETMAKPGENIYKRKDGRWEGRYRKGRKADGKLIYGYVYSRKYGICKKNLDEAKANYFFQSKREVRQRGMMAGFVRVWFEDIVRLHVKTSTYNNYVSIMEKWVFPYFGELELSAVERRDVQWFISDLSKKELSPGTIRNVFVLFKAVMKKAQEYGYIKENCCEGIRLPKMKEKETKMLTLAEQKQLEKVAKEDKNGAVILLASYTGLRVGEICGLKWQDIDFEKGIMRVSRTVRRVQCQSRQSRKKTAVMVGSTKSDHSARTIPLPLSIQNLLKEQREISAGTYVFEYRNHLLEPRILQYRFKALLKKAGLPGLHFHSLRHTFATRCIELCIDVKTISEFLGHASAKMTLDRYGHSQMEQKRRAMKTLDDLFIMAV